ncbi:MAG: methyl-accepting chemotaxis protein [Pirellulaceae bacterium]
MNWFYNMKTMKKLVLGFATVCAIMVFVGYMGVTRMGEINKMMTDMYDKELLGISAAKEANINVLQIARAARNVLLAKEQAEVIELKGVIEGFRQSYEESMAQAKPTFYLPNGMAQVAEAEKLFPAYMEQIDKLVELKLAGNDSEAIAAVRDARVITDKFEGVLTEMVKIKTSAGDAANRKGDETYATAFYFLVVTISGGTILALAIGIFIARIVAGPLNRAVTVLKIVAEGDFTTSLEIDTKDEVGDMANALNRAIVAMREALSDVRNVADGVASSSQELASASEEISTGAQEQASSLEETASSLEEITVTIKQNASNAEQANQLSASSREVAEKGGKVVGDAVTGMREINESSKRIADIITTIDEIAFQTNLLALNAAVEAARAGEQGRGFAVVAGEVRNLAQRSAAAAKEIKTLIQDSVRKVEIGSDLVNQSGQTLEEIINSVKRVTEIISEISSASREQAIGIEQVNRAVAQMDQVTQENASQTEELSGTAESLSGQAEGLQDLVRRFVLDSGRGEKSNTVAGKVNKSIHAPARPAKQVVTRKPAPARPESGFESGRSGGHTHELDLVGAGAGHDGFEEF